MRQAALAAVLSLAAVPAAGEFRLALPVDCIPGDTCFIQQFVDRDTGPGVQDFTCSSLSYDGHKGTDFALPTLDAMNEGVNVLASAAGVVTGVRDGMSDRLYEPGDTAVDGRECGNGVVIDHGDGWETQYCHMKSGTVSVGSGDSVKVGDTLGQIGLSGKTQFPHLHISVRRNGQPIDPFLPDPSAACGTPSGDLWAQTPEYSLGGVIYAGFFPGLPDYGQIKQGNAAHDVLSADSPGLVLFAYAFGGQRGDVLTLDIQGPQGEFLTKDIPLDKAQAQFFRAAGKKLTHLSWPKGAYSGTATLRRNGETLSQTTVQTIVK